MNASFRLTRLVMAGGIAVVPALGLLTQAAVADGAATPGATRAMPASVAASGASARESLQVEPSRDAS